MSLISVLLVYDGFLFPFITTKQLYFNILIEAISVFWIMYLLKYPEERPKRTWVGVGLVSYFSVVLLTCFTGVDFNLSFWGDIERMLGFFHIVHFLVLYFMIITVMREWKDWKYFLLSSVIVAQMVSLYGITGRAFSSIGNTAYVAGYLIFNFYFALILFFREEDKKKRWVYLLLIPLMVKEFLILRSSGGTLGVGVGLSVFGFLYGVFSENTVVKRLTLGFSVLIATVFVVTFVNKDMVKSIPILSDINVEKNTFQTRLISWRAAMRDLPNHYLLGTGFGNYAVTFDKYFEPTFYDFTRSETYFDRAHNNIIEIVSTTGLFGLIAYLSIFLATGLALIKGFRSGVVSLNEFALVVALLVSYFVQNLAVFDSLATFIGLMITLAYVYWLVGGSARGNAREVSEVSGGEVERPIVNDNNEKGYLIAIGLVFVIMIFQFNVKPIKMLKGTILGQIAFAQNDIAGAYEEYKRALSYETGLDRDARGTFAREISSKMDLLKQLDKAKADEIILYAIGLLEANVEQNPLDSLTQMQLAQVYRAAAMYYIADETTSSELFQRANNAVDLSIESSPGRIRIYFSKVQILLSAGRVDEAIEVLKYAVSLNENYYDSVCHLGSVQLAVEKEGAYDAIDRCLELNGHVLLQPLKVAFDIMQHYKEEEDSVNVVKMLEQINKLEPGNALVLVELAKYYATLGENEKARDAAARASVIDPAMKEGAEKFIEQLN